MFIIFLFDYPEREGGYVEVMYKIKSEKFIGISGFKKVTLYEFDTDPIDRVEYIQRMAI